MPVNKRLKPTAPSAGGMLRAKQLLGMPWTSADGGSGTHLVMLAADGCIYRYSRPDRGWLPYPMKPARDTNYEA